MDLFTIFGLEFFLLPFDVDIWVMLLHFGRIDIFFCNNNDIYYKLVKLSIN